MTRRFQFSVKWVLCVALGAACGASSLAAFVRAVGLRPTVADWGFPLVLWALVSLGFACLVWMVISED